MENLKYRTLLIDDEEEIREGMARIVPWEELGYQIIGTAENGMDALEIVEKELPDVVITDIQMPFMDGLTLIEKAAEFIPNAKFLVFSGYERFEYAQRAVKLQVAEYLLKPFSLEQLKESLTKLKKKMDEEKEKARNIEWLNRQYEESLPLLRDNFWISCLNGSLSPLTIQENGEALGIPFAEMRAVVLFQAETSSRESVFSGNEVLFHMALKNIFEQAFEDAYPQISFVLGDQLAAVVQIQRNGDIAPLLTLVNEVCREAKRLGNRAVLAGIGGISSSLLELRESYREAQNALAYSYLLDQQEMFTTYSKDVEKHSSRALVLSDNEEREMINVLKYGTAEKVDRLLDKKFQMVRQNRLSPAQFQIYLIEHLTLLLRIAALHDFEQEELFGERIMDFSFIEQNISLEESENWFREKCRQLNEKMHAETQKSGKSVIRKAKLYIKENFADQTLSVEKIAAELYLSPAYFSSLFKKEEGQSVVSFLTEQRLQEAVRLLETTEEKTYLIAEKVGYTEANYFSYVFKKQFGISPSNYRKQKQTQ